MSDASQSCLMSVKENINITGFFLSFGPFAQGSGTIRGGEGARCRSRGVQLMVQRSMWGNAADK
jgi:hypothetical protein